jgi:hypothetical protein
MQECFESRFGLLRTIFRGRTLYETEKKKCVFKNFNNLYFPPKRYFFLWRYSPNLSLGLPPWNSPFHFGLLDLRHSVGLLGQVISLSQGLYLYTNTEKHTHTHKHTHKHWTSMPWVGFEPTIPASERAKTEHVLDRSATVTGLRYGIIADNTYYYIFANRNVSIKYRK